MTRNRLMTLDEVHGAWIIMPTPAREGAQDWRAQDTVDLEETARVVEALIAAGADAIMGLGTLGECASLTWEEKQAFMGTAVEAARGRVPVFMGTTTLNTRDTIAHTRRAAALGVAGTMLGMPMWCQPTLQSAVQFYRDVAEACPDTAICVYANAEAFRFDYPAAFWAQMAEIPQVICAKYLGVGPLLRDIGASKRRIRFLPVNNDYWAAARIEPDFCTAFWSGGAVCGPELVIALRDEIAAARRNDDWSRARKLSDAAAAASALFMPPGGFAEFARHNIGLEKERANAGGWMRAGPCRPPYHLTPESLLEGARKSGRRWAELAAQVRDGSFFQ